MGSLHIADALAVLASGATLAAFLSGTALMIEGVEAGLARRRPPSPKAFWALFALSTALWAVHVAVA